MSYIWDTLSEADVPLDLRSEFLSAHLAESWQRHLIGMAGVPYRCADMFDGGEGRRP